MKLSSDISKWWILEKVTAHTKKQGLNQPLPLNLLHILAQVSKNINLVLSSTTGPVVAMMSSK